MILADSSVWISHLKLADERMSALLRAGQVLCHPYIVLELACGTQRERASVLRTLAEMQTPPVATNDEVLQLVERYGLYGRGCGMVDLSLLASVLISANTRLWTLDKRLDDVALELGCAYTPSLNS